MNNERKETNTLRKAASPLAIYSGVLNNGTLYAPRYEEAFLP